MLLLKKTSRVSISYTKRIEIIEKLNKQCHSVEYTFNQSSKILFNLRVNARVTKFFALAKNDSLIFFMFSFLNVKK